jgi:hypothetical protein
VCPDFLDCLDAAACFDDMRAQIGKLRCQENAVDLIIIDNQEVLLAEHPKALRVDL